MAIDIEKILSMTATEWSTMTGKELNKYNAKGIHHNSTMMDFIEEFKDMVPSNAEVVVDYKVTSATSGSSGGMSVMMYGGGIALIPKKR